MRLLDETFEGLKRGLSLSVFRHELISENLANISTPGYKRKDVDFRAMLQTSIENSMSMVKTNASHISMDNQHLKRKFAVTYPNSTDTKSDSNNVDVDREIVQMVTNNVYYSSMTTMVTKKLRMLNNVIAGRPA